MGNKRCYRLMGYQYGFEDGQRTGGKMPKKYIESFFESETRNLSHENSQLFKMGWHDGFTDAVNKALKSMVMQDYGIKSLIDEL